MSFINFALALLVTFLIVFFMIVGKAILLPLVIAIFFWYLINALAQGYKYILPQPRSIRLTAAIITFIIVIWTPIELISETIPAVAKAAPVYQANLEKLITRSFEFLGVEQAPVIQHISDSINLGSMASKLAGGLADFAGNAIMILVYMIFLFIEQGTFSHKIAAIFSEKKSHDKVRKLLGRIYQKIQKYLWIKTLTSVVTGLVSYAIMLMVGLDFAEFWALLVFFLNYIPSIGGILATAFPALLALVQFDGIGQFAAIAIGIGATQFIIGNMVEPRIMGATLNLSPLIIIISLVTWGTIWGIPGMFLCVPLTVILAMVMAEFKKTRSIAILLSSDGRVG